MKKLRKSGFLEGAFIATLCIIISKVLGIIYVIPFYKLIGGQGGTLYGYAYNIYNVFLIISSAGIPLAISKLTSEYNTLGEQNKKIKMYEIATRAIMIFSVASFLICFIFAPQLSHLIIGELEGGNTQGDVTFVIRSISLSLLVIPMLSICRGYLQGHRYIKEPSYSQVIEQVVRIVIILLGSYLLTRIFSVPIKYAVGVSLLAACIGGIVTYIYLQKIVKKNRKQLNLDIKAITSKEENREIIKKIILYSIPFIVINLANTLYNSTDMILVIKTLPKLGISAIDTEYISSVFTTWGLKFNSILSAVSTGLIVSLIPNMVKDYTENNINAVNKNFNKCLKIVLLIIAPIAIYLSIMSESVWGIFYGKNYYGYMIIRYTIIVTIFDCLYMINNSLLQSLNKSRMIYISVIVGLVTNLILDVPLMYLFEYLKLPPYYGAITASLIGFILSDLISLIYLSKNMKLKYMETLKIIPRFILSILVLTVVLLGFRTILPIDSANRIVQLFNLLVSGIISGIIYLLINYKHLKVLLPEKITRYIPF